jgi:hypothetical protein
MLNTKRVRSLFKGKPHEETIRRWVRVGVLVSGVRLKLECEREGGRMYFTEAAVVEFNRKRNGGC